MLTPPPPLVDDLVEEVLLRISPEDPASLVRAALVCKRWRRLVSGSGFRRRFREFHRTPPMLGLLCWDGYGCVDSFVPSTAFRPRHAERARGRVLDVRHGRVLLGLDDRPLVIWDPIRDKWWKLPFPPQYTSSLSWTAAVLCSAAGAGGCDHLDCHRRPFIVVFVASMLMGSIGLVTFISTYSSDAADWSGPTCSQRSRYHVDERMRSAVVGNTLYFGNLSENTLLMYNMQLDQMSWIQLPSSLSRRRLLLSQQQRMVDCSSPLTMGANSTSGR